MIGDIPNRHGAIDADDNSSENARNAVRKLNLGKDNRSEAGLRRSWPRWPTRLARNRFLGGRERDEEEAFPNLRI